MHDIFILQIIKLMKRHPAPDRDSRYAEDRFYEAFGHEPLSQHRLWKQFATLVTLIRN
ncbi:hypothetical protein HB779_14065 [Phyllobacterium sp. 628]|uniref:hypothetical protein n=1 Tax=Phyllobacterium sp. 628 TaxID=2718938 RepID=UPI0016623ECD|nr:hypothetical protein [Phyllobacterium sp. 628]QND52904.1 hypothetical protein HB779_14065 [Phyllobacterium sp. 628]